MARDAVHQADGGRVGMTRKASLSDMVMEFFEEMEAERKGRREGGESDHEENDQGSIENPAEDETFWMSQRNDLQEALARDSLTEKKIRADTEEALRRMRAEGSTCSCSGRVSELCRKCLLSYVAEYLKRKGYNSALQIEMEPVARHPFWRAQLCGCSGRLEIRQEEPDSVVIELNLRGEFEMARPSQQYKALVDNLPELFVGKSERLRNIVRTMCSAAKRCMRDNNMHMGPWRKHKYMQSKWLSTPSGSQPPDHASSSRLLHR